MFNVGDLIIYSGQGICRIDDISEKTYFGETKNYYTLHPIEGNKLEISIPVDNDKVVMLDLINRDEAEEIIKSFSLPGVDWIEINSHRAQIYSDMIKKGHRKEIATIINTLMRHKYRVESKGRKFYEQDSRLLTNAQSTLFAELAMSLNTSFEEINERIIALIAASEELTGLDKEFCEGC
jgi:CarD family transcriptional regulator